MSFNLFNYINIGIVAVVFIPFIIAGVRHEGPMDGFRNKIAIYFFQLGQLGSFALMILPLMVKDGQFVLPTTNAMYIWIFTELFLLILYVYFWVVFFRKGNSLITFCAIMAIPPVIFIDTAMRFGHMLLLVLAIVYLAGGLMLIKDFREHNTRFF